MADFDADLKEVKSLNTCARIFIQKEKVIDLHHLFENQWHLTSNEFLIS